MPTAEINETKMDYAVKGQGDPLVMIMELGGGQNAWRFHIPTYKKYFRVITFDNRGVGKSDTSKGPSSIRQMADDVVGLMDHLGIKKAHVLGVSMGGTIAQELAINYPERVSKLILGCTYACHNESNGRTPEYKKEIELFIQSGKVPGLKLMLNRWQLWPLGYLMLGRQFRRMSDSAKAGFIAQWEAAGKHNTLDQLSKIKAPTLVIMGTGDHVIRSSSSDTLARLIPNARLVKVDKGSHMFPVENIGRFNKEVLSFLKSN